MTAFICSKFALMTTDVPCTIFRLQFDDNIDDMVDSAQTDIQVYVTSSIGFGDLPSGSLT